MCFCSIRVFLAACEGIKRVNQGQILFRIVGNRVTRAGTTHKPAGSTWRMTASWITYTVVLSLNPWQQTILYHLPHYQPLIYKTVLATEKNIDFACIDSWFISLDIAPSSKPSRQEADNYQVRLHYELLRYDLRVGWHHVCVSLYWPRVLLSLRIFFITSVFFSHHYSN